MKRREFITLLGAAAMPLALPIIARGQQQAMPVVGFLRRTAAADAVHLVRAFREGLGEHGFVEGQNVAIEYRWADHQPNRLPALAAELVRRQVSVIASTDSVATLASKDATSSIPIVFVFGNDPVRLGLASSLNRPEGNITGVSFVNTDLGGKRVELLHEVAPTAARIAILVDINNPEGESITARDAQEGALAMGREIVVATAATELEFKAAFATFVRQRVDALLVTGGPFFNGHRRQIVALALRHGLPTIYSTREYVEAGGLMSYGTSQTDAYRRAGAYVGRIFKGAKPADLPVEQPIRFQRSINLDRQRGHLTCHRRPHYWPEPTR